MITSHLAEMNRTLMSLGTLATILSLASDPLVQQIVSFESRTVSTADPRVHILRATSYSQGVGQTADLSMSTAFLQGLSAGQAEPVNNVSFGCPNGNCAWTSFKTLGICSSCFDVSPQLSKFFNPANNSWDYMLGITRNLTTLIFLDNYLPNSDNGGNHFDESFNTMNVRGYEDPALTFSYVNSTAGLYVASISVVKVETTGQNITRWPNVTVTATECGFQYCIHQLHSKVTNGVLDETILELPTKTNDTISHQSISWEDNIYMQQPSAPNGTLQLFIAGDANENFTIPHDATASLSTYIAAIF